jgi:hypothetical protein
MSHSAGHRKRVKKKGKKKAHEMEVAAAAREHDEREGGKRKVKRTGKRKATRKIKRSVTRSSRR